MGGGGADGVEEGGSNRDWMDEGEEQADRKKDEIYEMSNLNLGEDSNQTLCRIRPSSSCFCDETSMTAHGDPFSDPDPFKK